MRKYKSKMIIRIVKFTIKGYNKYLEDFTRESAYFNLSYYKKSLEPSN